MCLITEQKNPLIAKRKITVYKVLSLDYTPFFHLLHENKFKYNFNELYETEIKESDEWTFSAVLDRNYIKKKFGDCWVLHKDLICLGQGFHSINTIRKIRIISANFFGRAVLCECTIPKGAEYYKDKVGNIISNKLIINKQIEF